MSDPDATWQDHAACTDTTVDFFPARGESLAAARAICGRCPVATQCLDYALAHSIKHGVWGGLSERDRRRLRRERNGPRPGAAPCGTNGGHSAHRRRGEDPCDACRAAKSAADREYRERKKAGVSA